MKKPVFFILCLALAFTGFSQSYFGFQLDMGNRKLIGITPGVIENPTTPEFYMSPSVRFRKLRSRTLSFEAGLGYTPLTQDIRLIYFSQGYSDKTLSIKLHYLTIPLALNYSIPFNNNSSLLFTGSMETLFLLSKSDNYQDIRLVNIGYRSMDRYSKVVFTPGLSTAYQTNMKNCGLVELGIYATMDMTRWIGEDELWDFHRYLYPSRSIRYGIRLKYFLNSKNFFQHEAN